MILTSEDVIKEHSWARNDPSLLFLQGQIIRHFLFQLGYILRVIAVIDSLSYLL